ncbi:MAG: hypothetical protein K8R92_00900 [Planctomycetes bacterium]|nr:hypothetical protein [Planctomycetota bacterium]
MRDEIYTLRERLKHDESLSFNALRSVNVERAMRWHPGGLEDWSVNDWLLAFGGEAGEALNAGKKHRRILSSIQQHGNVPAGLQDAEEKIMEELADAVIYADLCAARLGKSLGEAVVKKFNAISVREGFPERICKEASE